MSVGRIIRDARRANHLRQSDLAQRIDSTQRQISLWETGKRSPQVVDLERIAAALHRELVVSLEPSKPKRPTQRGTAAFDEVLRPRKRT
jgi:transcriptional regulator with XRE-family HTH domain